MAEYKPNLEKKVTVRTSTKVKDRIGRVCERADVKEAEVIRYLLEAGLALAEREGLGSAITVREEAAAHLPTAAPAPRKAVKYSAAVTPKKKKAA